MEQVNVNYKDVYLTPTNATMGPHNTTAFNFNIINENDDPVHATEPTPQQLKSTKMKQSSDSDPICLELPTHLKGIPAQNT